MKNLYRECGMCGRLMLIMLQLLIISSCSKSTDHYKEQVNVAPILKVKGPFDTEFYETKSLDSVKLSQIEYPLLFKIEDEEKLNFVDVESTVDCLVDTSVISFLPQQEGVVTITLKTFDSFLSEDTLGFKLCCFKNLQPIAGLRIYNPADYKTPLQKTFDASESFDRDEKYGGEIILYRFLIEGFPFPIETEKSKIDHVFAKNGSYEIGVSVMDNDSTWSEIVFENIMIIR
jgi:hypothetical protein